MRIFVRLVAAGLYFSSCSAGIYAQQIMVDTPVEPPGTHSFQVRWDSDLERVIAYRDVSEPNLPAIRILSSSGSKVSIFPLKDFPGSGFIDIWDATGAPNGDIVVAAILGYGPRNVKPVPLKSLLLTYDGSGTLKRVWDVKPYHHHRIAADSAGNVFALGDGGKDDYPLLIKYSESGEVLGEFLSSGLFSAKDSVVDMISPNGQPQLFIKNDRLNVWIAATRELYAFSLDGVLLSSTSLSAAVQSIADQSGSSQVRILEIQVDSNQGIISQVRLFPKDQKLPAAVGVARLKTNGSFDSWVEPFSRGDVHRFMGLTSNDKAVFLEKVHDRTVAINLSK
ncbi:MAG TPA: hypothetical protein VIW74_15225 [Pyrinomonadaceae bacterium]|jgi:hypothetical protein